MFTQRQFLVFVGVVLLLAVLLTPLTTYAARQREQAQAAAVFDLRHGPPERQAHAAAARAFAANCLRRAQADDPSDLVGTVPCAANVAAGAYGPLPVYDATGAQRLAVPDPYGQGR